MPRKKKQQQLQKERGKSRERRQHIRHGGKLLQVTVCVIWFVASHVPPNIASEVTWNVCINVPAPQLEEQLPLIYWPIQFTAANKQYMSRFRYGGGKKYGTQKNGIIVGTEMDSVSQKKSPTKYSNKQQPHISMFSCQHRSSMLPFGEEDWELYINATEFDKTAPSGSFVTGYVHCKRRWIISTGKPTINCASNVGMRNKRCPLPWLSARASFS